MIKLSEISLNITEPEYRDMNCISYSFLSSLDKAGVNITNGGFQGGKATELGQLIEDIVFDEHDRNKYAVGTVEEPGDTLKKALDDIAGILVNLPETKEELIEAFMYTLDGNPDIGYYPNRPNDVRAVKMYEEGKSYIEYLIVKSKKIVISGESYEKAHECANVLKNHPFTRDIFDMTNMDSHTQFKGSFTYRGLEVKFMIDLVKIDHTNKIIWLYDLKTGEKKTENFQFNYHYFRYDIQDYIYTLGARSVFQRYFPDYQVVPIRFVYISVKYAAKPLIFKGLGDNELIAKGYYKDGKSYQGVDSLIDDYKWYLANSFNVEYPKKIYDVNGVVSLNLEGIKKKV